MRLFVTALISLVLAFPAFAGSKSNSQSGAQAIAIAGGSGGKSYKGTGTAIGPGLVASGLSCSGSSSVGVGGAGWGVSLGSTRMDKNCDLRENTKIISILGDPAAGKQLMCNIPEVREAYARVGRPCAMDRNIIVTQKGNIVHTRSFGYPTSRKTVSQIEAWRDR